MSAHYNAFRSVLLLGLDAGGRLDARQNQYNSIKRINRDASRIERVVSKNLPQINEVIHRSVDLRQAFLHDIEL